jgi:hypothetical protein
MFFDTTTKEEWTNSSKNQYGKRDFNNQHNQNQLRPLLSLYQVLMPQL